MKRWLFLGLLIVLPLSFQAQAEESAEPAVSRFADLALECVHQEYPNKISHGIPDDKDVDLHGLQGINRIKQAFAFDTR